MTRTAIGQRAAALDEGVLPAGDPASGRHRRIVYGVAGDRASQMC
jgi:hypothetical protein